MWNKYSTCDRLGFQFVADKELKGNKHWLLQMIG